MSATTTQSILPERRRPHAFHLAAVRLVRAPREHVFDFLTTRVPACYTLLSRGHERYVVEGGGPVRPGARIDCREHAGPQRVHHTYEVLALERPRRLHYASTPSRSWVEAGGRTYEGTSDTHVYYDLTEVEGGTRLEMAIVIEMGSLARKWLAALSGTHALWRRHQDEELERLVTLVEATAPGAPLVWRDAA
jgi:hypothetical protein